MSLSEISKDKLSLVKTIVKYDDSHSEIENILKGEGSKAPYESNTLLLQILLEIACKNVEPNVNKRQSLFLKMWNQLTEAKLTNKLKFHMDALFSVRNRAVAEFEKELIRLDSLEKSPPKGSSSKNIFNEESKINFGPCLNPMELLSENHLITESSSIYLDKYHYEFEELSTIGEGGFGTVSKVRHKIDDVCYAVKKVMFKYKQDSDYLKVIREVKSFASLNHLNVVGYNQAWLEYVNPSDSNSSESSNTSSSAKSSSEEESLMSASHSINTIESSSSILWLRSEECHDTTDSFEDDSIVFREEPILRVMLYIQMEYCDCDLRLWIDERTKGSVLPFHLTVTEIFRDILNGVAHIHSKNIIHRDLKPQNIFYSAKTNSMKIGDFGLATLVDELKDKSAILNCGTLPYAAPEMRTNSTYDSKVDMYSLGVILIELMSEAKTRMELSVILQLFLAGTTPPELSQNWSQYISLLQNLVSIDPTVRYSAEDVFSNSSLLTEIHLRQEEEIRLLRKALVEKENRIQELEALLKTCQLSIT